MPALKDVLEGKPLKTPVHAALVHLPIALFPISLVLDLASHLAPRSGVPLVRAAFICLAAGLVSALVAAVFGLIDYTEIRDDHPARKTATVHLVLNLIAVGLYAGSAGLRFTTLNAASTPFVPLLVSVAALGVLFYSGYLGGVLVYDDGIGVGRHRRLAPTPLATIVVSAKNGPVVVADEKDLAEGEALRVAIDGTVAAVARVKGNVYAFQEFCPHRYGPLSEGCFKDTEVQCPWHRSKFDVRTGKVTAGPAKIDLRTFHTEVRDGKIWIHPPS